MPRPSGLKTGPNLGQRVKVLQSSWKLARTFGTPSLPDLTPLEPLAPISSGLVAVCTRNSLRFGDAWKKLRGCGLLICQKDVPAHAPPFYSEVLSGAFTIPASGAEFRSFLDPVFGHFRGLITLKLLVSNSSNFNEVLIVVSSLFCESLGSDPFTDPELFPVKVRNSAVGKNF